MRRNGDPPSAGTSERAIQFFGRNQTNRWRTPPGPEDPQPSFGFSERRLRLLIFRCESAIQAARRVADRPEPWRRRGASGARLRAQPPQCRRGRVRAVKETCREFFGERTSASHGFHNCPARRTKARLRITRERFRTSQRTMEENARRPMTVRRLLLRFVYHRQVSADDLEYTAGR